MFSASVVGDVPNSLKSPLITRRKAPPSFVKNEFSSERLLSLDIEKEGLVSSDLQSENKDEEIVKVSQKERQLHDNVLFNRVLVPKGSSDHPEKKTRKSTHSREHFEMLTT